MRTKNAKRLWPVPATLAVMALAAFLAFGLLATTGAQPAAAQDDPDCTVPVTGITDNLMITLTNVSSGDNVIEDCSVHGDSAVLAIPGDIGRGSDDDVTAWVYAQNGTIEGDAALALNDVWDYDETVPLANQDPVKATKFSAIRVDVPPATQSASGGGDTRSEELITITPASGKSKVVVYIYYSAAAPIPDPTVTGFDHDRDSDTPDVKRLTAPIVTGLESESGILTITFLGAPSLTRADDEQCFAADGTTVETCDETEDRHDSNMDDYVDHDTKADPASDLYVLSGDFTNAPPIVKESQPDGFAFGEKGPYDIDTDMDTAQGVYIVAIVKDGNGEVLSDSGDNKAKGRVTFSIAYAAGSDLETNPITPMVDPVDDMGMAMTLLNHWDSNGDDPVRATVSAMYSGPTGDLDLGEVDIFRDGPAMTADFATYSCEADEDADGGKGCAEGNEAVVDMRFAQNDTFVVSGKFVDSLGNKAVGDAKIDVADDDEDGLTVSAAAAGDKTDAYSDDSMLVSITSVAEYRVYTITVTNGETGDDEVTQDLTFTVAGPPMTYVFDDPAMYIPATLGSSQMFTLIVTDENGNVPDFTDADDVEIVVLGVEGSYVTGRDNNNAKFDTETGVASFTIFAPVGATQGQTVLIQVRVDDEVVATHTVMFGVATTMPGMPMNVMAMATSHDMITVTWDAADDGGSDITGYMVQRGYMDADNMMWMDVDPAHMGMDMMYMDMGLMAETTYYYRVAAMNSVGMGEYSDGMAMDMTMEAADTDTSLQDIPDSSIRVTNNANSSITVNWMGGDNADSFIVVAAELGSDPFTYEQNVAGGAAKMATISGLNSGSNYMVIVIALQGTNFEYGVLLSVMAK